MLPGWFAVLLLLAVLALVAVLLKKLTPSAGSIGVIIGFFIFLCAGYSGLVMLATFFMLGTLATSYKIKLKQSLGFAEDNKGRRTTGQVVANAGVAALLGLLSMGYPHQLVLFQLMIAGSLSSATADTLSSELGNVYGSNYFNIITFKKDRRGLNGVISFEGTIAGLAGSTVIAFIYSIGSGFAPALIIVMAAGTIGNLTDSVLGATLERKKLLTNNGVNFLNTATGALISLALYKAYLYF